MSEKKFTLKVFRGSPGKQYWERFHFELSPGMNVISALMQIRRRPLNAEGKKTTPVVWEDGCLEEVCGSCSMLIDGIPRQACSCVIEREIQRTGSRELTLAPMTKFPLVRDLMVDRSIMFENLKKIQGWIEADGSWDSGPGPKISPREADIRYVLSTCMTCGVCSEGCPQVNDHSKFMGPAVMSQVRLFNSHPTGQMKSSERNRVLMGEEGIQGCGNAQNCRWICPKNIPLTDSIAWSYRELTKQSFKDLF